MTNLCITPPSPAYPPCITICFFFFFFLPSTLIDCIKIYTTVLVGDLGLLAIVHSSVAFHLTPYRMPFQLQIKFQWIESLSHSSGLAACPSSSLLSLSPVTLLKGVDAPPPLKHLQWVDAVSPSLPTDTWGLRFFPQSAKFCKGSTLSPPSLLKFAWGRRFLPQSATDSWERHFLSQSAKLCTGSTLSLPVC